MIKDAIANIAKPPVFSTANAAPVLPIHSGAVQRGQIGPIPDDSGLPHVLGYTSSHISDANCPRQAMPCVPIAQ
jgi:hypothetical protein